MKNSSSENKLKTVYLKLNSPDMTEKNEIIKKQNIAAHVHSQSHMEYCFSSVV